MLTRADINVTPMIDVMLVLLIIFMIVTPIISSHHEVLPRSEHAAARPPEPREITLSIDRYGTYFLATTDGAASESAPRVIAADALPNRLEALYAHRTQDRILYLKADKQLAFGTVQEAIEIARRAGVRLVATVTACAGAPQQTSGGARS
jgi:biopolymer transport protein ExbD